MHSFVASQLPADGRVLEVGCGQGALARALAAQGHDVVAIDPEAPAGAIFRGSSLEDFAEPGPFAAVVANRSLHHIHDLAGALDKIARLLGPDGRLVLNEHAFERFDQPTVRWHLDRLRASGAPASARRAWEADHAGLHTYRAMRAQLDLRFQQRFFAWVPYLYGELGDPDRRAEEQALIDTGGIQATDFRYVGQRPQELRPSGKT